MSAPSSTSAIMSFPADDSSSNRESVLRSNARFSIPPLVGVLDVQMRRGGNVKQERENIMIIKVKEASCRKISFA